MTCISTTSAASTEVIRSGALVFQSGDMQVMLLDATGEYQQVPIKPQTFVDVSPWGTILTWWDVTGYDWWSVTGATGHVEHIGAGWWYPRQWLADDRVMVGQAPVSDEEPPISAEDAFTVLSLRTNEVTSIVVTTTREFGPEVEGITPRYAPDLQRAAYLWLAPGDHYPEYMVIWDIGQQREVATLPAWTIPFMQTPPTWRLDGTAIALVAPTLGTEGNGWPEIIMVDIAGQVSQLTNIQHSGLVAPDDLYMLWGLQWSPDGRYVAFFLEPESQPEILDKGQAGRLLIYDVQTTQVLDYCIEAGQYSYYGIHWSPTSEQLAYVSVPDYETLILDIARNQLTVVSGAGLRGWLNMEVP